MNEQQKEFFLKAKERALHEGGLCLSEEYINAKTKIQWKCSNKEHPSWFANYNKIVHTSQWCPLCKRQKISEAQTNKNGFNIALQHAKKQNGILISEKYIHSKSKMEWKCSNTNHNSWMASFEKVVRGGTWCPKCANESTALGQKNKDPILKAQAHALTKNGKCLSTTYINADEKLEWKCSHTEHTIWFASYYNVVNNNQWCPKCKPDLISKKRRNKNGLILAQEHAISKGGLCLSTEYINSNTKLEWKCSNTNHSSWMASWGKVVQTGTWCPICASYYYKEHQIRALLEYLLNTKLIKTRPEWNKNPKTNKNLELDGYSKELNIAFEFQGLQHYEDGIFKDSLENTQYRDRVKKENCIKQNVKLIVIDDYKHTEFKDIFNYILNILNFNKVIYRTDINLLISEKIFRKMINHQEEYFNKALSYAEKKKGTLLSTSYIDNSTKMEWKCNNSEHISWLASYEKIVNGKQWCPLCKWNTISQKTRNKNGLQLAKEHAINKNGQCLSTEYINCDLKLKWKCSNPEHKPWNSSYYSVVSMGTWCPQCAGKRLK